MAITQIIHQKLISKIKDNDLRKEIVTTYTKAKGLLESYSLNNELFENFNRTSIIYKETESEKYKSILEAQYRILVDYAHSLKQSHEEIKVHVNNLLGILRKILSIS